MTRTIVQGVGTGLSAEDLGAGRLCAGAALCRAGELARIAPELAEAGYRSVELHPHHLAEMGDSLFRRRVTDALAAASLSVACVYVGVPSDRVSVSLARARCEMAAELGARCVFVVPASRRGAPLAEAAARVREVCEHAGALGLTVAVHNHAGTSMTTAEDVRRFLAAVGMSEAGLCLDVAHLALFEDDVAVSIGALVEYVRYVHLKDLEAWARETLAGLDGDSLEGVLPLTPAYTDLGAGTLDLPALAGALYPAYDGWTTIEMETLRAPTFLEQARRNGVAYAKLRSASSAEAVRT